MTSKRFCILLLVFTAAAAGQNEDIPVETDDNQFPPNSDGALMEGSGDDTINKLSESVDSTQVPLLEEVLHEIKNEEPTTQAQEDQNCPKSCSCHFEGAEDFVVDCSGNGLTEFPLPLDPKTTSLNIKNNKITEIPKDIATLTNLKVLNADNNIIMDLALGSVSGLPQLTVLTLSNNHLIEYPKDLKNSIDLTNLKELNLGGNDMRTELNPETFMNFHSLRKLTLAKSTPDLLKALCGSLKSGLETVCTESCETQFYDCKETLLNIEDNLLAPVLPNVLDSATNEDSDPVLDNAPLVTEETVKEVTTEVNIHKDEVTVANEGTTMKISGNSRLLHIPEQATPNKLSFEVPETTKNEIIDQTSETDVNVGATTTDGKPGGVDKSVIGIIVAGMVVVVAGIAIKKNWSSIRKRFSSTPSAAERAGANANGTTPEEIPLQDKEKSPV